MENANIEQFGKEGMGIKIPKITKNILIISWAVLMTLALVYFIGNNYYQKTKIANEEKLIEQGRQEVLSSIIQSINESGQFRISGKGEDGQMRTLILVPFIPDVQPDVQPSEK